MIPLSQPYIVGKAWDYVKDCLDTGWVSSVGSYVDKFEQACASYVGKKHAVACVNGTAALHMALMVAGVKANDEVILPTLTFAAPAFAVRYIGAYPVFMDVDPVYWQIDIEKVSTFLANQCEYKNQALVNRRTGRTIKAIIAVDLLGHPVDMEALLVVAKKYGLKVIEDNAESLGSSYKNCKTGRCADITCLSFNGNKVITCGGGGVLLTDDEMMAKRVRYLTTQAKDHALEYIHEEIGYNYRLTNLQAALGLSQIEQLDEFVIRKRNLAQEYDRSLSTVRGLNVMKEASWAQSSFWLYTILIDPDVFGMDSRKLLIALDQQHIQSRPLWHPLHSLKPFVNCDAYEIECALRLYATALSIPSSVNLTQEDQNSVINAIKGMAV